MSVREWVRLGWRPGEYYQWEVGAAYRGYSQWCSTIGRHRVSVAVFTEYLASRGLRKVRERVGAARVWYFSGTLLEEESDVLDGVGQAADGSSERERSSSIGVVGVDVGVVFEVDHCVIRVPASLYSRLGRVLQILAHDGEPTERGVS